MSAVFGLSLISHLFLPAFCCLTASLVLMHFMETRGEFSKASIVLMVAALVLGWIISKIWLMDAPQILRVIPALLAVAAFLRILRHLDRTQRK